MRQPHVRLTVRRLMLAVLVLAALLGAFEAGRRIERNRAMRERQLHEALRRDLIQQLALSRRPSAPPSGTIVVPAPTRPE